MQGSTLCWGPSVSVPRSRVGISCLRLLIQPFRLWKGPWIFYSFKTKPPCLAVFGMEGFRNGVPSADPLVPKARPSHGDLGRVRVCCLQPPQSPCDPAMGTHCCAEHPSAPCPAHKQVPLSPCLCFLKSEGCCMKSGEQARRLSAWMCLSGKTSGTSPNTLILNT